MREVLRRLKQIADDAQVEARIEQMDIEQEVSQIVATAVSR
ncbi:hypothetical protein [Aeoliella mucimassa]|nr:hypothetical protein [Aeoliella mucimassa]